MPVRLAPRRALLTLAGWIAVCAGPLAPIGPAPAMAQGAGPAATDIFTPGRRLEPLPPPGPDATPPPPAQPPAPAAGIGPAPLDPAPAPADGLRFLLKGVHFAIDASDSPFTEQELAVIVAPLIGRMVGFDDLEAARRALNQLYTEAGFVASGVLLPDQTVRDGVVTFSVLHGRIAEVAVDGDGVGPGGLGALSPDYVRARIADAVAARPFDLAVLQERLRVLLNDRNIARVRAAVRPGDALGEAALALDVTARRPYDLQLAVDDDVAPTVGDVRVTGLAALRNLFGVGDQIVADVELSEGGRRARLSADAPIGDGLIAPFVFAEWSDAEIVEPPLSELDVESMARRFGAGVRLRLFEDSRDLAAMDVGFELARSETRLLGAPFSFSPGVENGETRLSMLRLGHIVALGRETMTIAFRSQVTVGLDAFDATISDDDAPDGRFVSWIGQAQAVARVRPGVTVIARGQTQLSSDALLPLEDVSIGGRDTVRGYRRGVLVADQAAAASLEGRIDAGRLAIPDVTPPDHPATLTLAPFVDVGAAWNKGARDDATTLAGAGLGLLWSPRPGMALSIYAAAALNTARDPSSGEALRNDSFMFAFSIALP